MKEIKETKERKLIKTFPGLPEGAGIYEHEDGSQCFYNCAPGQPPQAIHHEVPPPYYSVNADGSLTFDKAHHRYQYIKAALKGVGIDLDEVKSEEELEHFTSAKGYGAVIYEYLRQQDIQRKPKTLMDKINRAIALHEFEEADRLIDLLERKNELGLTVHAAKKPE